MRRTIIAAAAALSATLLIPVGASAQPNGQNEANQGQGASNLNRLAAVQCRTERRTAGRAAFRSVYGKNAMRNCIRANRPEARAERRNAAQECAAEREEMGVEAFREQYGTNPGRDQGAARNAFGKCVSEKARAGARENGRTFGNAARECRAERREVGIQEFREQYGTERARGRNAFGKCVSSKVREASNEEK